MILIEAKFIGGRTPGQPSEAYDEIVANAQERIRAAAEKGDTDLAAKITFELGEMRVMYAQTGRIARKLFPPHGLENIARIHSEFPS